MPAVILAKPESEQGAALISHSIESVNPESQPANLTTWTKENAWPGLKPLSLPLTIGLGCLWQSCNRSSWKALWSWSFPAWPRRMRACSQPTHSSRALLISCHMTEGQIIPWWDGRSGAAWLQFQRKHSPWYLSTSYADQLSVSVESTLKRYSSAHSACSLCTMSEMCVWLLQKRI